MADKNPEDRLERAFEPYLMTAEDLMETYSPSKDTDLIKVPLSPERIQAIALLAIGLILADGLSRLGKAPQ